MSTEGDNHYQNCSMKSEDGTSTMEMHSNGSSFDDDDDDRPVYANQSTLNRCRKNGSISNDLSPEQGLKPISMDNDEESEIHVDGGNKEEKSSSCCDLLRCFLTTFGLTVAVASFIFVGAFLFTALEGPNESSDLHMLSKSRNDTITHLAAELRHIHPQDVVWKEKLYEYFAVYEEKVVWACNRGYKLSFQDGQKRWRLKGSLYFVVSILTTVGN